MERVEGLLRDMTVRQRLYAIACMAAVRVDGEIHLQHLAGYAVAPTREEASQTSRQLAVKRWPNAEQWDAWVEEIPDDVILLAAQHIRAASPAGDRSTEDGDGDE